MKKVVDIIKELRSTSSRNEKEAILTTNKDNETLKKVFYLAYDPSINFYIKSIPYEDNWKHGEYFEYDENDEFEILFDVLETIYSRELTGNKAISFLTGVLSERSTEMQELICNIVKKDLDCGVQTTTINKIWKGLITDPPYMGYQLFSEKLIKSFKLPCYSQIKLDGLYADVFVMKDSVSYRSRSGINCKFKLPDNVEEKLLNLSQFSDVEFVLHCEALVRKGESFTEFEERKIGNGYLNSDESDPGKVVIVIWDVVGIDEYNNRKSTEDYSERFNLVEKIVEYVDTPHVQMVESRFCNATQDVIDHFVESRSKGMEGTVIKSPKLKWKDGKVKDGLKLKNEFVVEMKIIGFQEHSKRSGQIGAIFVESEDGVVKCKVGSGLTDAQRKKFFLTQDEMIGKIVTVKGNDLVTNELKQDRHSVFLPRFVEVRDDKTVADMFDKIMATKDSIIDLLKNIK
ncbi:putative DNA ligase [Aeromonas phage 4L372XY]|uniref:DNA ligase n=1 Tax=Aeromonas phage 4L372XY TaxID=2588520 RepID=A0A5B9N8D3_9CAUD|nr:putative DNA ligase [Aeromonas phage 4L372XY]QEG08866.1 putative DNA ligase [Aeromonas phage 4L372XY]